MSYEAPLVNHHTIDGANTFGFGTHGIKVVDNLLLIGEGNVETVEAALLYPSAVERRHLAERIVGVGEVLCVEVFL